MELDDRVRWPPPYVIHFAGTDVVDTGLAIAVDEQYVFWWENHEVIRLNKDGSGSARALHFCGDCGYGSLIVVDGYVFALSSRGLVGINRETGEAEIPAPAHHKIGALAHDDKYLYAAEHGCRSVSRYGRATLELLGEMELSDSVQPRAAGNTHLSVEGGRILCSAPDNPLFAIDGWNDAPRQLRPASHYRGSALNGSHAYWSEIVGDSAKVCHAPFVGGEARCGAHTTQGTENLLVLPGDQRAIISAIPGFEVVESTTPTPVKTVEFGRPLYFVRDEAAVYATAVAPYWIKGEPTPRGANIVVRIPFSEFANEH